MVKKKKTLSEDQKDVLADLFNSDGFADVKKKLGSDILFRASEEPPVQFIPTHVFPWDWATNGGFPIGRSTTLYGPKSSSKTSMGLRGIASMQNMCASCWQLNTDPITGEVGCGCGEYREPAAVFINSEQSWDPGWATALGVDANKVGVSKPEYGEAAADIGEYLIRTGNVHLILLDSLADLVPAAEIKESTAKSLMGEQSRLIGKLVRKWLASQRACERAHGFKPTIIFINQIRFKLGVMFGSPETTPGGQAPGFLASLEVRTRSEAPSSVKKDDEDDSESIGMAFRVTKSKVGPAFREGEYRLMIKDTEFKKQGAVYDEDSVVKFGQREGMIMKEGSGNKWKITGVEKEDIIVPSKTAMMRRLQSDHALSSALRMLLLKKLLGR